MEEEMTLTEDLKAKRLFCPACDCFEWHLLKYSGEWECLGCWTREMPLESRFPHLFKDNEENNA